MRAKNQEKSQILYKDSRNIDTLYKRLHLPFYRMNIIRYLRTCVCRIHQTRAA